VLFICVFEKVDIVWRRRFAMWCW